MKMLDNIIQSFQIIETFLNSRIQNPRSLSPEHEHVMSFTQLGQQMIHLFGNSRDCLDLLSEVGRSFLHIVEAQYTHFPENIFWDFDYFLVCLIRDALAEKENSLRYVREIEKKMIMLQELFGIQSPLKFRYVHDFMYGYDWIKWVQKDAENRKDRGPFSSEFLDYLIMRGLELHQNIHQKTDMDYQPLSHESEFRNVFSFSREPDVEIRLFSHLARQHLIPVETWNAEARPDWNKPYYDLREKKAVELEST
ncbi:MAG: hypothetical protein HQM11_18295 [SAR324 cluster bacterium]|nr:hypothetical protein [SAR324 cluster bacterium]